MLETCADCGIRAPDIPTDHATTLLSLNFGWRVRRNKDANGVRRVHALCPTCFAKERARGQSMMPSSGRLQSVAAADLRAAPNTGELVFNFRDGKTRETTAISTQISSMWVLHSLGLLKRHGLFNQYAKAVAPAVLDSLRTLGSETFCDINLAIVHYQACDSLALTDDEIILLSAETGVEIQNSLVQLPMSSVSEDSDHRVWTVLGQLHAVLLRLTDGGGAAIFKPGRGNARIEVARLPLAKVHYFRVALRGVLLGMLSSFASDASTLEIEALCTDDSLGYQLLWGPGPAT